MSDALPLPPRADLKEYQKLAKEFQAICNSMDNRAVRNWTAGWLETVARRQGLKVTPDFLRGIDAEADRVERRWREFEESLEGATRCRLADARLFLARAHGFQNWPKFARYVEGLSNSESAVAQFEAAVDSIVCGDVARLEKLLKGNRALAWRRSTREHHSTLLHYVSANGVEGFRQKTPNNIVEIARLLLEAGADVNAESDAYGGRSTTLGLTATSYHPEAAGVQLPLMELLIENGALLDGPDGGSAVVGCLHNGRGAAARFLADRGARLDLEGSAGVGRLDVVKTFFRADGRLKPPATAEQMKDGFAWACEFGHADVVRFLLQRGIPADATLKHNGQTGLHWAAYGGHAKVVQMLLSHGAEVDAKDKSYHGTPLGWALYAWGNPAVNPEGYYEVVVSLVRAGARLDAAWFEEDIDRWRAMARLGSDARMEAAVRGEMA